MILTASTSTTPKHGERVTAFTLGELRAQQGLRAVRHADSHLVPCEVCGLATYSEHGKVTCVDCQTAANLANALADRKQARDDHPFKNHGYNWVLKAGGHGGTY